MTIHIDTLTFDVIIGLLDFERDKPQRVIIDCTVDYTYQINQFIDYADIVLLIQTHLKEARYALLEDALDGLQKQLKHTYPAIEILWLKISKPDIIPACSVALSQRWNFKN